MHYCFQVVLIETSWNVKIGNQLIPYVTKGSINRNIVECKGKAEQKAESVEKGINRNIVECKADNIFIVFFYI